MSHNSTPLTTDRGAFYQATPGRQRAGAWIRLSPFLVSLLSTALSTIPAALSWSGYTFGSGSDLYLYATQSRTSVQVAIGIMASLLGGLWTYALCTAFNLTMRSALDSRHTSVETLRLYVAISKKALDSNLPVRLLLLSALFSILGLLPSWLWTGALTPQTTTTPRSSFIAVPRTGADAYSFLPTVHTSVISHRCRATSQPNGTFTNCPGISYSGRLIDSISSASTSDGTTRNHTKFDNSGYSYSGRSYGAGASTGLVQFDYAGIVQTYHFFETGYVTDAKCMYNRSSAFSFTGPSTNFSGGRPNIYYALGPRPNQYHGLRNDSGASFAQVAFDVLKPSSTVALSAGGCCGYENGTGPFYVSVAAGLQDRFLNKVQCDVFFMPKRFDVTVAVSNRTIFVSPLDDGAEPQDPAPGGQLREWTLRALQSVSMVQTSLYVSMLGEAFANNVINKLGDTAFDSTVAYNSATLPAIEDSITASIDDIITAINGYALTQPHGYNQQPAVLQVSVAQIGSADYHVALFALDIVALIMVAAVSAWTRLFAATPEFDFADMASMMAAVSNGCVKSGEQQVSSHLLDWEGHAKDVVLSKTVLKIECKPGDAEAPTVQWTLKSKLETKTQSNTRRA